MDTLFETIEQIQQAYRRLEKNIYEKWALTAAQWRLIHLIGESEASLSNLIETTKLDKSTLSRQLDQLVKKELLLKTRQSDFRSFSITLTQEGVDIFHQGAEDLKQAISRIGFGWPDDEIQMLNIMLARLERSFNKLN